MARTRSALEALRQARYLSQLHARASRLLLRPSEQHDVRSRRLYRHVLRQLHVEAEPSLEGPELGRRAAGAIRASLRPLWQPVLRIGSVAAGSLAILAVLIVLLSWMWPAFGRLVFPPDLGLTAAFRVTSALPGQPLSGVGTYERGEVFFHTNWENRPHIDLDFGRPVRVRTVVIDNRRDCCGERALPLDVKAVGSSGERFLCQRRAPFRSWTCHAGGVKTQRLRIEVPGSTMLHLRSIEVYE